MRDYVNPLVLLGVVALFACRVSGMGGAATLDTWLLTLCVTAFVADAAVGVARLLTHRRALMSVVWAVVFLILGCSVWVVRGDAVPDDAEAAHYRELKAAYAQGGNPLSAAEDGDCLLTVAASVGSEALVQEILRSHGPVPAPVLAEAGRRAAENGRAAVLQLLLEHGLSADATAGSSTLLCAAAQNAAVSTTTLLLQKGAKPDMPDAEGTPPLIHAVQAESAPVVRLLLQAGANPAACDADGRDAASYSRSSEITDLLPPTPES